MTAKKQRKAKRVESQKGKQRFSLSSIYAYSILCTLVLVPFANLPPIPILGFSGIITESPMYHSKILVARVLLAIITALGWMLLIHQVSQEKHKFKIGLIDKILIAFVATTAVSASFAKIPILAFMDSLLFWLLAMVFLQLNWLKNCSIIIKKIPTVLIGSGVALSLLAIFDSLGFHPLNWLYPYDWSSMRNRALFLSALGNPEYVANYLAPVTMIAIIGWYFAKTTTSRLLYFSAASLMFTICFYSQSRGFIISTMGGALFLGVAFFIQKQKLDSVNFKKNMPWIIAITATLIITLLVPNPLNNFGKANPLNRLVSVVKLTDSSSHQRLLIQTVGAQMAWKRPLIGLGSGMVEYHWFEQLGDLVTTSDSAALQALQLNRPGKLAKHLHNDWLELLVEFGMIGLFLFTLMFCVFYGQLFQQLKIENDPLLLQFGVAISAYLAGMITSFPLHTAPRQVTFWILVAGAFALLNTKNKKGNTTSQTKV